MILVVRCKIFRAKLVSPPQMILGSYAHEITQQASEKKNVYLDYNQIGAKPNRH